MATFYSFYNTTTSDSTANFTTGTINIGFVFRQAPPPPPPPPVRQARPAIHPCAVLGVPCEAPLAQIRSAYRLLARKYHADTGGEHADDTKMALINNAYEMLTNAKGAA